MKSETMSRVCLVLRKPPCLAYSALTRYFPSGFTLLGEGVRVAVPVVLGGKVDMTIVNNS